MLIVLGIIAFIATLVGAGVIGGNRKAKQREAVARLRLVASTVERFELDCGVLPAKLEDLRQPPAGVGPYLSASQTRDPWGTPYQLIVPGSDGRIYSIRSLGADRAAGGQGEGADLDRND